MAKHQGFWMNVDGEMVHMLADPEMSAETAEALGMLVKHVRKLMDEGHFDDPDKMVVCPNCQQHKMKPGQDKCGACRLKEIQERFK